MCYDLHIDSEPTQRGLLREPTQRGQDNRLFPTKPTDNVVCGSMWVIVVGHIIWPIYLMVQGCSGRGVHTRTHERAVHELFKMAVRARTDLRAVHDGYGRMWTIY